MEPATILVVDDLPDMRETLEDCLTAQGYRVVTAASAEAALALIATQAVDLVLTDVVAPHLSVVKGTNCL